MKRTIYIAFTGGGTGGHIFPIIAVAEELKKIAQNNSINLYYFYIGPTRGPIDIDVAIFEKNGIVVKETYGGKGKSLWGLFIGFLQSLWHLYIVMPDILFSKGGYGAAPVIAAAVWYRIPIFIHESDAVPGKTNLKSARFARRIAIAFSEALQFFPPYKSAITGNPINSIFFEEIPQKEALEKLGLPTDRKTIFFIGGSQGAQKLNDIALDILPNIIKEYNIIHQCGAKNFQEVKSEAKFTLGKLESQYGKYYKLYGFLDQETLKFAYFASDIVISRSGAGSIFEIAAVGKPSILIPFRYAAQDHQRANAYAYAKTGAALVIEEENLTPNILISQIKKILEDPQLSENMKEAAKAFSKKDSAKIIAEEILRSAGIVI
jgi:UDP-N-acetylglucosamine--N-acetylmuramyl-(pentapeptide) pyrophosphoryl-undecaprenol N-acetylglucosamine transferase